MRSLTLGLFALLVGGPAVAKDLALYHYRRETRHAQER
jgi:hypothetical protein